MLIAGAMLFGNVALAITPEQTGLIDTAESAELTVQKSIPQLVGYFINVIIGVLSVVLLVIVVYGGILYMTAGGNDKQTEKARAWLINGSIGLIICVLAFALSTFIVSQVEGLAG